MLVHPCESLHFYPPLKRKIEEEYCKKTESFYTFFIFFSPYRKDLLSLHSNWVLSQVRRFQFHGRNVMV